VRRRSGKIGVGTILGTVGVTSFGAMAMDLSSARVARNEIEGVLDLASKAGAYHLDRTETGMENAVDATIAYAGMNKVAGKPLVLTASQVKLGYWANGFFVESTEPRDIDSVAVVGGSAVGTYFADLAFGVDKLPVNARSTAYQKLVTAGAGEVDCYLPLAVSDCLFDYYPGQALQGVTLRLNHDSIDNVGWANPDGAVSANTSKNAITSLQGMTCMNDGVTAQVDAPVWLQNGTATSAMSALASAIDASPHTWDTALFGAQPAQVSGSAVTKYGRVFGGPIMLFHNDSYCQGKGGKYNQTQTISGFAMAWVYDVKTSGAAADKTIKLVVDLSNEHELGIASGGPSRGVVFLEAQPSIIVE
jgi:hypothetical protein